MNTIYAQLYPMAREMLRQNAYEQIQTIINRTAELSGAAETCLVLLDDHSAVKSAYGRLTATANEIWQPLLDRGLAGYVVHSRRTVTIRSIESDPRWAGIAMASKGSAVGLPLIDEDEHVFGVLLALSPQIDYFNEKRLAVLTEIAQLASGALPLSLEQLQAEYLYGFRQSAVPMLMINLKGTVIDANDALCESLGQKRHTLLGMPVSQTHLASGEWLSPDTLAEMREGEEVSFRAVLMRKDGEFQPVLINARRVMRGSEPVIELVEQDISAEMEIEQLRSDLTAMVYHDLRNPLNTMKASVQRLNKLLHDHPTPAVHTLLETGTRSVKQLHRMIDSLLDIQRLEQGNTIINAKRFEITGLLEDAISIVQPVASDSNMQIISDFSANLPFAAFDVDMILRVVTNLLENAVKYTGDGGKITLRAFANERELVVSVRDSGPGIPYHMQRQIFDKFTRVKYKDAPKGIGLGLAFCKLAVEAHGGQVWVESEPGHGAEFIFTLPLAEEPAMAAGE